MSGPTNGFSISVGFRRAAVHHQAHEIGSQRWRQSNCLKPATREEPEEGRGKYYSIPYGRSICLWIPATMDCSMEAAAQNVVYELVLNIRSSKRHRQGALEQQKT
ncbi:unnamed protein product [Urochloa humidicola]